MTDSKVDSSNSTEEKPFYRTIRSFVKREGKITTGQQTAIDTLWATHGVDLNDDPSNNQMDFTNVFGRDAEIVMEIGFGNGLSLAEMAENAPETNFFGVEVHRPGVGSLLVQVRERDLGNVRVSGEDAVEVLKQVPENSLDRMQIFFPDPWHKKRHHKRRLIKAEFVETVIDRLKTGGKLHVATDWENYAEHVMELLAANTRLQNEGELEGGYLVKPEYRPETKYERRGVNLGHGVWDLVFTKV